MPYSFGYKKQDMLLPNDTCPLDAKELAPYLRILGFSDNGRPLLKQIEKKTELFL